MTAVDGTPEVSGLAIALRPLVSEQEALIGIYEELCAVPLPSAESPGMRELADEGRFVNEYWPRPVQDAHSHVRLLALAALDHFMAYTDQLRGSRIPYFAGPVTARAALDAASLVHWLSEPGIGTEARVQRGQAMALSAGLQMLRAPNELALVEVAGDQILARIENGARALGWATSSRKDTRNRPSVGNQVIPRPEAAIRALLDDPAKPPSHPDESAALWWHLSAYTHSALHALMGHVETIPGADAGVASLFGLPQGRIYTNGSNVSTIAVVLGRGIKTAMHAYRDLLNIEIPQWYEIHERWWDTLVDVFESIRLTD